MNLLERASYSETIANFLLASASEILGTLAQNDRFSSIEKTQSNAWREEVDLLKSALSEDPRGHIFIEFEIPRIGKRADVVLLIDGVIVVIEFKVGASAFDSASRDQAEDYALDLKNFHLGSHTSPIVPVLVATDAKDSRSPALELRDGIANPILSTAFGLKVVISAVRLEARRRGLVELDPIRWAASRYSPTPTIVEAARVLFRGHRVESISRSDAGAENLTRTCNTIYAVIETAKRERRKAICFVTGVPGSGKTLAGLNLVTGRRRSAEDEYAVFLSGNGPLVAVLQEALAQDAVMQQPIRSRRSDAERQAKAFIQSVHHFRDEGLKSYEPPVEKVVVFDEAQRAWDHAQTSRFMKQKRNTPNFQSSEPEFLLSMMDRHPDWCVVVCLVGEGQEINDGEAGIQEWLAALEKKFPHWVVYGSSRLNQFLRENGDVAAQQGATPVIDEGLHLDVSLRSFRAEKLADFINALLDGQLVEAQKLMASIPEYSLFLTRDIETARMWLRVNARSTERAGLVASSNALRLKRHGIHVKDRIDPALWFLTGKEDVRSSFQLEDVATEFDTQGLELDWVGVCWDANLRREGGAWSEYRFWGTVWQKVRNPVERRYVRNAYRVLLTRGRQGLVIFVPPGNFEDATASPQLYDPIYEFLRQSGIPTLDPGDWGSKVPLN